MVLKMDKITIGHFRKYFFSATNEDGETVKEVVLRDVSKSGPPIIASQGNLNHPALCISISLVYILLLCTFCFL